MGFRGPSAVSPIDKEALSEVGGVINPFSGRKKGDFLILCVIFLNVFTMMDAGLTYILPPIQAFRHVQEAAGFCQSAVLTSCTKDICETWASDKRLPKAFCSEIEWGPDADGKERCKNCQDALVKVFLTEQSEMLKLLVGFLTDIGTVLMGLVAARQVLKADLDKAYIDITWGKKPLPRCLLANFLLTQPLGMAFMTSIFQSAFDEETEETVLKHGSSYPETRKTLRRAHRYSMLDPSDEGDGATHYQDIRNFDDESFVDYQNWEDFFNGSSVSVNDHFNGMTSLEPKTLVEKGEEPWKPKMNVPKQILGYATGERTVGAWSERPTITFLMVSPVLVLSLVTFYCS